MKKFLFPFVAILVVASALSSCKKDDDNNTQNEFTYDGATYTIANGFLRDSGPNSTTTHDWDVFLTTSGITSGATFGLTGMGDMIYLDLNCMSDTGLLDGTYNWSSSRDDFTIVDADVYLDYDVLNLLGTILPATAGSVTISSDGSETTVTFNLTFADGKTASGEWKGVLQDF